MIHRASLGGIALRLLAAATAAYAHGHVYSIIIDGASYKGWDLGLSGGDLLTVGWQNVPDDGPVHTDQYSSPDIICHNGATPAPGHAVVASGGQVYVQYDLDQDSLGQMWPAEHHGPVIDMLAPCPDSGCETVDKTTLEFFAISKVGLLDPTVPEGGSWGTDELRAHNNGWLIQIPESIAPGFYVLRHELIALHNAPNDGGAQNYPFCFNLEITGSGTARPQGAKPTTFYTTSDPGIAYNIWGELGDYQIPGPAAISDAVVVQQVSSTATAEGSIRTGSERVQAPTPTAAPAPPEPTPTGFLTSTTSSAPVSASTTSDGPSSTSTSTSASASATATGAPEADDDDGDDTVTVVVTVSTSATSTGADDGTTPTPTSASSTLTSSTSTSTASTSTSSTSTSSTSTSSTSTSTASTSTSSTSASSTSTSSTLTSSTSSSTASTSSSSTLTSSTSTSSTSSSTASTSTASASTSSTLTSSTSTSSTSTSTTSSTATSTSTPSAPPATTPPAGGAAPPSTPPPAEGAAPGANEVAAPVALPAGAMICLNPPPQKRSHVRDFFVGLW